MNKIAIRIKNKTEKMAALFLLSRAYGVKPDDLYDSDIDPYYHIVHCSDYMIGATSYENDKQIIDFHPDLTPDKIRNMGKSVTIKLNGEYEAVVEKDGKVKVGCQTFDVAKIEEIIEAHRKLNA